MEREHIGNWKCITIMASPIKYIEKTMNRFHKSVFSRKRSINRSGYFVISN